LLARLFSKESLAVLKDKKLMIAVTAVIFVPLLYAGMFLWAFWDPYDHLEDIPVAIINEDVPYHFEGETFQLGDELIDKLKEEDEFDFHFVNRQDGYKGLKDEDYYILIEIPQDFSKNSTTLMDDHPEKLRLRYVPNESYNFLASQIGETAMLQIEMALEEKIIETYTETMFDQVDEIADGLNEAEDATKELDDGANELQENTHLLADHLATLAEKSIEFVDGTAQIKDGTNQLVVGTRELSEGVGQLSDASGQLLNGAKQVQDGQSELAIGLDSANKGVHDIKRNMPSLIDGTNKFTRGLKQFEKELPKQMAAQMNHAIEQGSVELNNGLEELEEGIINGLGATTRNPEGLAAQLANGLSATIKEELNNVGANIDTIPDKVASGIAAPLADSIVTNQKTQITALSEAMLAEGIEPEKVNVIVRSLSESSPTQEQLQAQLHEQITTGVAQQLPNVDETLAEKEAEIEANIQEGVYYAVGETEKQVSAGFKEASTTIDSSLTSATSDIEIMIKEGTQSTFSLLNNGINEIGVGQRTLQAGIDELATGTKKLEDGAQSLNAGQNDYVSQMSLFTSKFSEAKNGSYELATGSTELLDGINKLDDGALQLSDGADELAKGSGKLAEGMDTLKDGTKEFNEEMADAAREVNDVKATDETYNMMANPVEIDNEKINEVPNYGTGFAPYFLSLGLYVGALLLSIVYPLREPSIIPTSGFNWFLRKTTGLAIIGVLQALIAASLLLFGLGIEVQSVTLFYIYAIFTSWTFIAMIQFLVTCFDDPGRFMAIIILILQLTTSAGTFPLELIPKALQPFNLILPMTYTVDGFKAVISSGEYSVMWQSTGILLIFTIVSLLLTLSYFLVMFKRKFATMQEA